MRLSPCPYSPEIPLAEAFPLELVLEVDEYSSMPRKNGHKANFEQLLNDVKAVVRDGQEWVKISATELKEQARVRARTTDQLVRRNPYRVLGVAFTIGLVAGLIMCGRSRSEAEADLQD